MAKKATLNINKILLLKLFRRFCSMFFSHKLCYNKCVFQPSQWKDFKECERLLYIQLKKLYGKDDNVSLNSIMVAHEWIDERFKSNARILNNMFLFSILNAYIISELQNKLESSSISENKFLQYVTNRHKSETFQSLNDVIDFHFNKHIMARDYSFHYMFEFIDYCLTWDYTEEGWEFWHALNASFMRMKTDIILTPFFIESFCGKITC